MIITLGFGNDTDYNQLSTIASVPKDNHIFQLNSYDDLDFDIILQVASHVCSENIAECECSNGTGRRQLDCPVQLCASCDEGFELIGGLCLTPAEKEVKEVCQGEYFDITFLIDGSGSVGIDNFYKSVDFVKHFLRMLDISSKATRVSLNQFGYDVFYKNYITRGVDARIVKAGLTNMTSDYFNSGTDTGHALQQVYNDLSNSKVYENKQQAVLVLTDGRASDHETLETTSKVLKNLKNTNVFSLGVGNIDEAELELIASQKDNIFTVEDFDALEKILLAISKEVCQDSHDSIESLNSQNLITVKSDNILANKAMNKAVALDNGGQKLIGSMEIETNAGLVRNTLKIKGNIRHA